ncbi:MAG: hypothetical protein M1816_001740 [Peltula sp. TS41687]|nr:MAG: hypothetical protein M1816_001740 [Peltula sp. TS41687]
MALSSRYSELTELQQLLKTKSLELAYAKSAGNANEIVQAEDTRLLHVRILLLEHENDELHEQLAEEDARAVGLEKQIEDIQTQYMKATSNLTVTKDALRSKTKELHTLETQLASLNVTSIKTTKLLTEKLSLEHELASLKPEIEHLRSQAASYQLTLSDKLSLQRELNTLQVELESEKRANQKLLARQMEETEQDAKYEVQLTKLRKGWAKEKQDYEQSARESARALEVSEERKDALERLLAKQTEEVEQDAKYEVQLTKLRKEWAKEKQDYEQSARESERALESSEERKDGLETKLEAMREKLRTTKLQLKETQVELQQAKTAQEATKTQLKETQVELQQVKAAQEAASTRTVPLKEPPKPTRNPRKRKAANPPDNLGTPVEGTRKGRVAANKREKRLSTMPGDKSTFSITPFLNRTASIAPESPSNEHPQVQGEEVLLVPSQEQEEEPAAETNVTPSAAPKNKRTKKVAGASTTTKAKGKAVLNSSTVSGRANINAPKATKAPVLSQVIEEENEENERPPESKDSRNEIVVFTAAENQTKSTTTMTDSVMSEDPSRLKKKRKLLGGVGNKTLFDDDESESARPALLGKGLFGGGKGFPVLMSKGLGLGAKGPIGAAVFSPLKKDRKASASASATE